jgi:hypothetical protein
VGCRRTVRGASMNPNERALDILQKARDALCTRLTERILDSEQEIAEDAEGSSYLSEIEAIYEQLGGRLAHLNAMLANLPPAQVQPTAEPTTETASEVVYADLASGTSATFDIEIAASPPLLGLPAPPTREESEVWSLTVGLGRVVQMTRADDLTEAAHLISEVFDLRPSQARRAAAAFQRQLCRYPDLARRLEQFGMEFRELNEYAAATLLGECFEFQAIDALLLVRSMRQQRLPGID